jgi:4-methyl-5(b-hydroxyethyl)-thiazole monophosphate biosynthesis
MKRSDKIDTKRIEVDVDFIGGQTSLTNKEEKIISEYIIMKSMQKKKVLVFLLKAFETMEFSVFIDVLGWARNDYGHNLFVDTCGFTDKVISTFNVPVIVDKTIGEINVDEYDALAIPGGFGEFGFYEEAYDERFLKLIKEFNAKGKIIATICSAALPLGKSGVLKNRKATTYHLKNAYWQKKLKEFGVNVVNEPIVVDGNIITSYCPETAPNVAFELLKMLTSEEEMAVIKKAMGF